MIFDSENMFFDEKAASSGKLTSDIVALGVGEAGCPLTLYVGVSGATGSGTATTALITAADEAFTDPVTLATYTELPVKAKLPRGNKGYMKLEVNSTFTDGKLTAGLVVDDDILD
jgi:hypothetical protein